MGFLPRHINLEQINEVSSTLINAGTRNIQTTGDVLAGTGIFSDLTNNYIPYETALGLVDSPINTDGTDVTIDNNLTVSGNIISLGTTHLAAEMYLNENTGAQTPVAGKDIGINKFTGGTTSGFSFEAGNSGSITETADNGNNVTVTVGSSHGMEIGDYVVISQTSSNGSYDITGHHAVVSTSATTIDIEFANWDSTETGVWHCPSQLTLTYAGINGKRFNVSWNLSVSCAGTPSGDIVDWGIVVNGTKKVNTYIRRTLSTGSVWGAMAGGGVLTLTTNDKIYMFLQSDDVNALTHRVGNVRITQL